MNEIAYPWTEGYIQDRNGTVIPTLHYYLKLRRMVNFLDGDDKRMELAFKDYYRYVRSIGGFPINFPIKWRE